MRETLWNSNISKALWKKLIVLPFVSSVIDYYEKVTNRNLDWPKCNNNFYKMLKYTIVNLFEKRPIDYPESSTDVDLPIEQLFIVYMAY